MARLPRYSLMVREASLGAILNPGAQISKPGAEFMPPGAQYLSQGRNNAIIMGPPGQGLDFLTMFAPGAGPAK